MEHESASRFLPPCVPRSFTYVVPRSFTYVGNGGCCSANYRQLAHGIGDLITNWSQWFHNGSNILRATL